MATKLFVGSLPYSASDDDLKALFEGVGPVVSATVIKDRDTNRSKGFGFVEMESDEQAQDAIKQLDGKDFQGRPLSVSIARPREERPRNNFGGGGNRSY